MAQPFARCPPCGKLVENDKKIFKGGLHFMDSYDKLLALWEKHLTADQIKTALVPLSQTVKDLANHLLFVGINPSFKESYIRKALPDLPSEPADYFSWSNNKHFKKEMDQTLDEKARENYPFFASCRRISTALKLPWDHIDLFFWRSTKQQEIRDLFLRKNSPSKTTEFAQAQLELSFELIEKSRPRCIIIANALASDIYVHHHNLRFDPELGCYEDYIGGKHIPVFLSSMLTGQRALDRFSFKRLVWHLGQVLGIAPDYTAGKFEP